MGRYYGSYRYDYRKLRQHGDRESGPRGIGRMLKQIRRHEAEQRNALTPHDRTKAHRLARCECK